jgi:hypothetical protein
MIETRITAARSFAAALSRRHMVISVLSTPIALSGTLRPESAMACKRLGQGCEESVHCCPVAVCKNHRCRGKPGWKRCGTRRCHSLNVDNNNCGACGNVCGEFEVCFGGNCV